MNGKISVVIGSRKLTKLKALLISKIFCGNLKNVSSMAAGGGITSAGKSISGHFIKKNISQSVMKNAEKFLVVVYTILLGFDLFKKGFDYVKEWAKSSAGLKNF